MNKTIKAAVRVSFFMIRLIELSISVILLIVVRYKQGGIMKVEKENGKELHDTDPRQAELERMNTALEEALKAAEAAN